MRTEFFKYQGTGNDFVIIDNRNGHDLKLSLEQIKKLCDRRFGIGADGLMLLNEKPGFDFEMIYFNSDGREGTMCGNGGRCLIKFAESAGIQKEMYKFMAMDGEHEARIDADGIVYLKMNDVDILVNHHGDFLVDTGSPHYVKLVPQLKTFDVVKKGREIRYSREFEKEGINVNFVEQLDEPDKIFVRTYERGVENETLSCGTGVTAAALVCYHNENGFNEVEVKTLGGRLNVEFDRVDDGKFRNIWLCGPAERVFAGTIEI
ncbi:MAG TPA: diaminopimelate epimerase [Chitinophagaceae bacterium]|nr:diaminopimelate epimerase [Chitinophagaceae bacterium]